MELFNRQRQNGQADDQPRGAEVPVIHVQGEEAVIPQPPDAHGEERRVPMPKKTWG